jgi:spore maturation protein CgeB
MRLVIFGLTLSSSWGNGHATLWRGLLKALAARGHTAIFYEKDVAYYAGARDEWEPPRGVRLQLYGELEEVRSDVRAELAQADAAIITSFCPDALGACRLIFDSRTAIKIFYDLDTPVTLDALECGARVSYLPEEGLGSFDLVLSYTGGRALDELRSRLGARRVAPLYGWVDPESHRAVPPHDEFRCTLSYLGTFAADRQPALEELLLHPARVRCGERFLIGGAQYPQNFPWSENIYFVRHLPPELHAAFFCSCRATLNVTRRAMARYGFCPSGRLFEAAACAAPILTDCWDGLECFFLPGPEVIPVRCAGDVLDALSLGDHELRAIGQAARERALEQHTGTARAMEFETLLETTHTSADPGTAELQAA